MFGKKTAVELKHLAFWHHFMVRNQKPSPTWRDSLVWAALAAERYEHARGQALVAENAYVNDGGEVIFPQSAWSAVDLDSEGQVKLLKEDLRGAIKGKQEKHLLDLLHRYQGEPMKRLEAHLLEVLSRR